MKRLLAWTLLAATLVLATPALAANVPAMVEANYVFRSGINLCSSTLIHKEDRLVLTNYHCIENAINTVEREEVQPDGTVRKVTRVSYDEVTLSQPAYGPTGKVGELTLRAEILAFSRKGDLAIMRILSETTPLPTAAKLPPDGYKLAQGQVVYGVGNPVGLDNTVTKGIISHLYREHRWESDVVAKYIQTDAAIAGGSSGGALYSDDDFLIGIPSAGYRGAALNFAIPFTEFKKFLRDNGFERVWNPQAPSREQFLETQKAKDNKR